MTAAVAPVTADPGRATGAARGAAVGLAVVQRRAAEAVLAVLDGRNADAAIAGVDTSGFDGTTRAALTDLTYGTLRFLGELRGIVIKVAEPGVYGMRWGDGFCKDET